VACEDDGVSEQPGRYQRSPSGMVGALLVTVLVILAFVAFRAFNRTDLDVEPQRVDYLAQVGYAQQELQTHHPDLVYPARLPSAWYATSITFSSGATPGVELSMLTADDQYVGFVQSSASVSDVLTEYVDAHPSSGPSVQVAGSVVREWHTWTDTGGDTALVAERDDQVLLVFGTVSEDQLEQLASSLTTVPVSG